MILSWRQNEVKIKAIRIKELNNKGEEALEAKASLGVSIKKPKARSFTLLPHSRQMLKLITVKKLNHEQRAMVKAKMEEALEAQKNR